LKLDYNQGQGAFFLRVPRGEENVQTIMREHGLDFSAPASTEREAVLLTHEPYAAVYWYDVASRLAREQLEPIHREIVRSWATSSQRHIDVPWDQELWDFQKADLDYVLDRTHALIADEPGLGKTPMAIAYANEIQATRVLVICPASIRLQWVAKIRAWTTMKWPYVIHCILHGKHGVHPHANWTVCSYELARSEGISRALAKGEYDLLVLDEAHYLKTTDAARTRAIFGGGEKDHAPPLAGRARRILALTGTPLPNRPREAYTLARGLCFDSIDWMSDERFRARFNPSRQGVTEDGRVYTDERTGRHAELQARLRANFMTRHLKRDVMKQLQFPVFDLIQLEETGPVRQALEAERLLDIDPEDLEGADMTLLGGIAEARRMMGLALAPQIVEFVSTLLDGGEEKLVLFGWHIDVLTILQNGLHQYGVLRVDGSTSPTRKQALVEQFIRDPRAKVMLGNILSLGTGTDGLQEVCCHALICEPDWVPGNNIQAFDRLDRGGQRNQVQGDIFVAPNSLAEKVLASALRKLQVTNKALDHRRRA